jgi:hypothetical protein
MKTLARLIALLAVLGLVGCGGGGGGEDDTTTDEGDDTPADTAGDTAEDPPDDTEPADTEEDPGEDAPPGSCGNGTAEAGEVCDDGNIATEFCSSDASACLADCSLANAECGDGEPDDGEQCDDGNSDSEDSCTTSCTENTGDFGDPCHCEGSGCTALDFTAGTIVGCSAVAALADGTRSLGCMTTAEDTTYHVRVYGAGGYCMLMALGCEGALCGLVPTTGDIDAITCPTGTAMATDVRTEMGMTITTKTCQQICTSQADCRWNEAEDSAYEDWAGTCGQWQCVPGGDAGEMICTDIRNVS